MDENPAVGGLDEVGVAGVLDGVSVLRLLRMYDDFTSSELGARWVVPGRRPREIVSPAAGGGVAIAPSATPAHRSLLGIRAEDQSWEARATVASEARLVVRLDDAHWAAVERHDSQIVIRAVVGPFEQELGAAPARSVPTTLAPCHRRRAAARAVRSGDPAPLLVPRS